MTAPRTPFMTLGGGMIGFASRKRAHERTFEDAGTGWAVVGPFGGVTVPIAGRERPPECEFCGLPLAREHPRGAICAEELAHPDGRDE